MITNFTKTKIVATLGPATSSLAKIEELVKSGATIFRLNTSHGKMTEHKKIIKNIKELQIKLNLCLTIIVDLQGPKIRIGNMEEDVFLVEDEIYNFKYLEKEEKGFIPIDYKEILSDIKINNRILLDDGKLELKVVEVLDDYFKAKVIAGGILTSRKGLNIPDSGLNIPVLTDRDRTFIKFAIRNQADYLALSFVRNKKDIEIAKDYLKEVKADIPIIAKIEKPQALADIDNILSVADGLMVARGDLGIELNPEKVPLAQKELIIKANYARKPVIVATQMLESMIKDPIPTRAEASDVANAILDGADAIMLSAETAAGKYPVKSVQMMHKIAKEIENSKIHINYDVEIKNNFKDKNYKIEDLTINLANFFTSASDVKSIVVFTNSGFSARLLSKARIGVQIVAFTKNKNITKRLNLFWGVLPITQYIVPTMTKQNFKKIAESLLKNTNLKKQDKVVLTSNLPYLSDDKTSFIRLLEL